MLDNKIEIKGGSKMNKEELLKDHTKQIQFIKSLDFSQRKNHKQFYVLLSNLMSINWNLTKDKIFQLLKDKLSCGHLSTRKDLAICFNVSEATVKKWFQKNNTPIPTSRLFDFAFLLNIPIENILFYNIDIFDLDEKQNIINDLQKIVKYLSSCEEDDSLTEIKYESTLLFYCYCEHLKNYQHNVDCILYALPLIDEKEFYEVFTKITMQNVKYTDDQYISHVIFHCRSLQVSHKALSQYNKSTYRYYNGKLMMIDDDTNIEYCKKISRFQTTEYFQTTIKFCYLSTLLKKKAPIQPDKPRSSQSHTSKKKSYPYQKSYDILFKINIPKTMKNIKYIFYNNLINFSSEQQHILEHILSSKKNNQFNKHDLFIIIQMLDIPSSQMIVYNFDCPQYQDLLNNFEYHFKNKKNTLNHQRYLSIFKSRYTISEVLGFLPLLSEQDIIEVLQSFDKKGAFLADSTNIIHKIVTLAKKSHYYEAKRFYFEVINYLHEDKLNRFKNEDPMKIVVEKNPALQSGCTAYLNLADNFQTLANFQFPEEITDAVNQFCQNMMK